MGTMRRSVLPPILLTVFLDMLGFGIVIPILAPLLIEPGSPVFTPEVPFAVRTVILGVIMGSYPLAQFFGAPVLGAISDRYGRKYPLIFSLAVTAIGYAMFAWGIHVASVALMVASRVLAGFCGGNIAIAYSAAADVSTEQTKAKTFGWIGAMFGLGLILGPLLGGALSAESVLGVFGAATPFWVAGALCVLNAVFVWGWFIESLKTPVRVPMSLLTGVRNMHRAFTLPNIRVMFLVLFLLTFGFTAFTNFVQVFLIERFAVHEVQIGVLFGYVGLWLVIAQGFVTPRIGRYLSPARVLKGAMIGLACSMALILLPSSLWQLYVILPFVALFQGIMLPNMTAVISNFAGDEAQGEILGINQSVQSLAMAIPAFVAGFLAAYHPATPIIASAVVTITAWIIYIVFFDTTLRSRFRAV